MDLEVHLFAEETPTLERSDTQLRKASSVSLDECLEPSSSVVGEGNQAIQRVDQITEKDQCDTMVENVMKGNCTKDNSLSVVGTFHNVEDLFLESQLKQMSKEELISHHIRVVSNLRREKETILNEKTDELYRLRRKYLQMQNHWHEVANSNSKKSDDNSKSSRHTEMEKLNLAERISFHNSEPSSLFSENSNENSASNQSVDSSISVFASESNESMKEEFLCDSKTELEDREQFDFLGKERVLEDSPSNTIAEHVSMKQSCSFLVNQTEFGNDKERSDFVSTFRMDIFSTCLNETIKEQIHSFNQAYPESTELLQQIQFPEDTVDNEKERNDFICTYGNSIFSLCLNEISKKNILSVKHSYADLLRQKHALEDTVKHNTVALNLLLKEKENQQQITILLEKQLEESVNINEQQQVLLCQLLKEQEELKNQILSVKDVSQKASSDKSELMINESVPKERVKKTDNSQDYSFTKNMPPEKFILEQEDFLNYFKKVSKEMLDEVLEMRSSSARISKSLEEAFICLNTEKEQKQQLDAKVQKQEKSIVDLSLFCKDFEKAFQKFEGMVLGTLLQNSSRLDQAEQQLTLFKSLVNSVALSKSQYKKMYDRKCQNLQKAEEEVDLLGDEVEKLLNLLEKVCATLNHYAPVLQHYPAIPEILRLINRVIVQHVDDEFKLYCVS